MVCVDFFPRISSPRRALSPLPHETKIDETPTPSIARVLKKQSFTKASAPDTRGSISPERREPRKLRRASASFKGIKLSEVWSPDSPRTSKSQPPPPYTLEEISNYVNAPKKLIRKSSNQSIPNGRHQAGLRTSLLTPAGSRQSTTSTQDSHITHAESRGEMQRQFAICQRLQRKRQSGTPSPTEVGAYLGGLERVHDEDGWVDGFRLEVEKPFQGVYAQPLQRGSWASATVSEKPKKVRFASVVECFEF